MIDFNAIKKDFPIFESDKKLVYLDSTATSLKPKAVIAKLAEYYSQYSANIFRGVYKISETATREYEETRGIVAKFIGASNPDEIVFTRNATESLNLIAYALGRQIIREGDEILTTVMEHHSNFVPWQVLAAESGAAFKILDIDREGYLTGDLDHIISRKTKILALTWVSNVLGTINPVKEIIFKAKQINPEIIVVVDASQAVPHMKVDVLDLGCDFLVFSSHKMLGPTGVGVLWGRYKSLEDMYPFMYGGEMISEVHLDRTEFKKPPHKFEAGTPAIAEVIALKEAVKYLERLGMDNVRAHEESVTKYAIDELEKAFGDIINIIGPKDFKYRGGVVAFTFGHYHAHDVASILDESGIAVRAGHHCAMPLHERLNVAASVRASFYVYNNKEDVDRLIAGLRKVQNTL
jgi:cysteine desulfurase/selenocysteine lyase